MNDTKQIEVKVIDTRAMKLIKSVVWFIVLFIAPIAIGILLDNTAMQWVGFIGFLLFVFLTMIVSIMALNEQKRDKLFAKKFTSVEDAIAHLEGLDK